MKHQTGVVRSVEGGGTDRSLPQLDDVLGERGQYRTVGSPCDAVDPLCVTRLNGKQSGVKALAFDARLHARAQHCRESRLDTREKIMS